MSTLGWAYCAIVVMSSLLGGLFPLARRITHTRLQMYLALSGGVMLGASFFHMIPESAEILHGQLGLYVIIGVLSLYFVQRFVAPHHHEMEEAVTPHGHGDPSHQAGEHGRGRVEAVSAWAGIAGLSVHSLIAGVAMGGAVGTEPASAALGFTVFLVVAMHKPADSLTVTAMLLRSGVPRSKIIACQAFFSLLVPLGMFAFLVIRRVLPVGTNDHLTGIVLAITAGMFICISLGDLLAEVQFHKHDRLKMSAALLLGVALMGVVGALEPAHLHADRSELTLGQHAEHPAQAGPSEGQDGHSPAADDHSH